MKIFTLVKSLFAVCILLFSLNALATKTPLMKVSDYDSPGEFCSTAAKGEVSIHAPHVAKYCGFMKKKVDYYRKLFLICSKEENFQKSL